MRFFSLLFLILTSFLGAQSLASQNETDAQFESYNSRPSIFNVQARSHPELGADWKSMVQAHIETVAQLVGLYPNHEIYFLARDSELLFDLAQMMIPRYDKIFKRIHLLNISRANMTAENIQAYLAQEGLSQEALEKGKKVLLVDTGFVGTIPLKIQLYFPVHLRNQIQTHLISSENPKHPSSRVFLATLNPEARNLDPSELHGTIISYEHIARYTDRSSRFVRIQNVWHAMSPTKLDEKKLDGEVSKEKALQYMEDLKWQAQLPSSQKLFEKRRKTWKYVKVALEIPNREQIIMKLRTVLNDFGSDPIGEALIRDTLDYLKTNAGTTDFAEIPTPQDFGLKVVARKTNRSNKLEVMNKYPQWLAYLENPEDGIKLLFAKKNYGVLGAMADVLIDSEFYKLLLTALSKSSLNPQEVSLIEALIDKKQSLLTDHIIEDFFTTDMGLQQTQLLKRLIERNKTEYSLKYVVEKVLSNPKLHARDDLIQHVMQIENADAINTLLVTVLSGPTRPAGAEALILDLLNRPTLLVKQFYLMTAIQNTNDGLGANKIWSLFQKRFTPSPIKGYRELFDFYERPYAPAYEEEFIELLKVMDNDPSASSDIDYAVKAILKSPSKQPMKRALMFVVNDLKKPYMDRIFFDAVRKYPLDEIEDILTAATRRILRDKSDTVPLSRLVDSIYQEPDYKRLEFLMAEIYSSQYIDSWPQLTALATRAVDPRYPEKTRAALEFISRHHTLDEKTLNWLHKWLESPELSGSEYATTRALFNAPISCNRVTQ